MSENLIPYDELVFRVTWKSSMNAFLTADPENKSKIENILSSYHGFLDIDDKGTIHIINAEAFLTNKLIAYTNRLGFAISPEGKLFAVILPLKEPDRRNIRKIDNEALPEVYRKAGIKADTTRNLQSREHPCDIIFTRQNLEEFPDQKRFIKTAKEVLEPRIRQMVYMIRPDALAPGCSITEKEAAGVFSADSVHLHDELACAYNINLMFNHIMKDFITGLPKNSEAVMLARRIISCIPPINPDEWQKNNITRTMKNENLQNSPVMSVITKINRPVFERLAENPDRNTFDIIRIRLGLVTKSTMQNRNAFLRKYKKELARIALYKIKDTNQFVRYGVPVNFLKIDHMTITCSDELELVFTLKELS